MPDSYRRHDSTIFTDELMNLIEPAPPSAERPLRQLLPNGANLMSVPPRVEGFEKHVQVHMDTKDHQIVEDRLGSSVLSG